MLNLNVKNNPCYYQQLVDLIPQFKDFRELKEIEKDKERTLIKIDFFQVDENVEKLANILKAFAIRNSPSLGYCQGFNFIAGQLLYVLQDEEKAFLVFYKDNRGLFTF